MRRKRTIQRRKRYFIGCEGESERSYAIFLQRLANSRNLAIHLDTQTLGNAGDPLEMVKLAAVAISNGEKFGKPAYRHRFLILDTDRLGEDLQKDAQMVRIAANYNIKLVKQNCCIEAVLLRHFAGRETSNPPTAIEALKQIKSIWPN